MKAREVVHLRWIAALAWGTLVLGLPSGRVARAQEGGVETAAVAADADAVPLDLAQDDAELFDLEIEALMDIEVEIVSKKKQRVSDSPAAVYVVTQEAIRRGGFKSIPEALRMVPGLNVARINASQWAISIRGFNTRFTNKLLVLIDGRSVYTPTFSGVYWEVQDTLIEDVDRIEVIRGPGGTIWGANAVNGVINIITKSARDTQGTLIQAGAGSEDLGFGSLRYGGRVDDDKFFRVYAKYFNRDDLVFADGHDGFDESQVGRAGFRFDWDLSENDLVTVQGDLYRGVFGVGGSIPTLTPPFSRLETRDGGAGGGNLIGRWTHRLENGSELQVQGYYDRWERDDINGQEKRDTFDLALQYRFSLGTRNDIVWGAGYRVSADNFDSRNAVDLDPASEVIDLVSVFIQDEISLVPDTLLLTVGTKVEHNDFTEFEFQPSARLLWKPHEKHSLWGSLSRAVRTPSRADDGVSFDLAATPGPPVGVNLARLERALRPKSEELLAIEGGYRLQPRRGIAVDVVGFLNFYDHLPTLEMGTPFVAPAPVPHLVVPQNLDDNMDGHTFGLEVAANVTVADWWRLSGAFSWLRMDLGVTPSSLDDGRDTEIEGQSPRHQANLRSQFDLPGNFELDINVYYVDHLPSLDISSYVRLDTRFSWLPREGLELSLVFQNVLDDRHPEFGTTLGTTPIEVEHAVYGQVTWRFGGQE